MPRLSKHSPAFTLLIASMVALPPLSIDLVLPALPALAAALGIATGRAGLAISLFLLGFALAQLVLGPASDRFGRRPVLLFSCALFAAAGFGCLFASTPAQLFPLRLVQGTGAGGCTAVIFAVVRDLYEGSQVRSKLAAANSVMGLAPMLAPTLGALLLVHWGWRGLFGFLALGGLALLAALAAVLPESIGANRRRVGAGRLALGYLEVLRVRPVLGCALVSGLAFGILQAYVVGSSFLFMGWLRLGARAYGLVFAGIALGAVLGPVAAGRCAARGVGHERTLLAALLAALAGTLVLAALYLGGALTVATALPVLLVISTALGVINPTAAHGVLEPMPAVAGTASAVLGSVRMTGGALASALVSLGTDGSPVAMIAVMLLCAAAGLAVWFALVRPRAAGAEADACEDGRPWPGHP